MKKVLLSLVVGCALVGCQKSADLNNEGIVQPGESMGLEVGGANAPNNLPAGCGDSTVYNLNAGQTIPVGTVTAWNDAENLYIAYETSGSYRLKEVHLYAGTTAGIPLNNAGNPRIGLYPYKASYASNSTSFYMRTIPVTSFGSLSTVTISSHAVVEKYDANGNRIFNETAWSSSPEIRDGGSWATMFMHTIQECGTDD